MMALWQTRRASIVKMLGLAMDFCKIVDRVAIEPTSKMPLEVERIAKLDRVRV